MPPGRYDAPRIIDAALLRAVSRALAAPGVAVGMAPFECAVGARAAGDFVYFDPPYAPLSADRELPRLHGARLLRRRSGRACRHGADRAGRSAACTCCSATPPRRPSPASTSETRRRRPRAARLARAGPPRGQFTRERARPDRGARGGHMSGRGTPAARRHAGGSRGVPRHGPLAAASVRRTRVAAHRLELGGRTRAGDWCVHSVNGSVRPFFQGADYIGVDLVAGADVDMVVSGDKVALPDASINLTISCECFEHNPLWLETFINMHRMTKAGGIVVVTCASRGRLEHGTARPPPTSRLARPRSVGTTTGT